jgi:hypothetical protein
MAHNSTLPPFLSRGEGDAICYSLAYCQGRYPRSRDPNSVAFLSIDFSTSPDFTRYSLSTRDAQGHLYSYHRGDDAIDNLEYLLLCAAEKFGVPVAYWQLYPLAELSAEVWSGRPGDKDLYLASRGLLCRILDHFRTWGHFKADMPPLFIRDPTFTPPSLFASPLEGDAVEITEYMQRLAAEEAEGSDA